MESSLVGLARKRAHIQKELAPCAMERTTFPPKLSKFTHRSAPAPPKHGRIHRLPAPGQIELGPNAATRAV